MGIRKSAMFLVILLVLSLISTVYFGDGYFMRVYFEFHPPVIYGKPLLTLGEWMKWVYGLWTSIGIAIICISTLLISKIIQRTKFGQNSTK